MQKKKFFAFLVVIMISVLLISCAKSNKPDKNKDPTAIPTPVRPSYYGAEIEGQPPFPELKEYWVVDADLACNFSEDIKLEVFMIFDALDKEGIAQIAVVCQAGIDSNHYGGADYWLRNWHNNQKIGSLEDRRAVSILIRPDVDPSEHRVFVMKNYPFFWLTPGDLEVIAEEAAAYANYGDFDTALFTLAIMLDDAIRDKWEEFGEPTQIP